MSQTATQPAAEGVSVTSTDQSTTQAQPAAPVPPQAQGAATVDVKAIVEATRDAVFAELRKSGAFEKKSKSQASASSEAQAVPTVDLRSLDRVLGRTGHAARLSESQYKRIETAYKTEAPDDVERWVSDYFDGWAPAANPPAPNGNGTTAPLAQRSATPISDGGSPPAPQVPLEERQLMSLSTEDRAHLIKTKGAKWYTDTLRRQSQNMLLRLR